MVCNVFTPSITEGITNGINLKGIDIIIYFLSLVNKKSTVIRNRLCLNISMR